MKDGVAASESVNFGLFFYNFYSYGKYFLRKSKISARILAAMLIKSL
jgi:hypothetical protein